MTPGKASRTALRVAAILLTLNEKPGWAERFPPEMVGLTEKFILNADIQGYGHDMIAHSKSAKMLGRMSRYEASVPGSFEGIGHRKLFMEQQFRTAMYQGIKQVAIIGAGFDTLCMRHAEQYADVSFVEIDHPDTQAAKKRGLVETILPDNIHFLPADLGKTSLTEVLQNAEKAHYWDTNAPAFFVVEGLLMYLTREDVHALFERMSASAGPGTRAAFSHVNSLKRYFLTRMIVRFMGEPWKSAATYEELEGYISDAWHIIDHNTGITDKDLEGFALAEMPI